MKKLINVIALFCCCGFLQGMSENFQVLRFQTSHRSNQTEMVAAYWPEKHINALKKSSLSSKSVFIFPQEYLEDRNLAMCNRALKVLRVLPQEQQRNIISGNCYGEEVIYYDCRKLCKILEKHSWCSACVKKKSEKQKKKAQSVIIPSEKPIEMCNTLIALGCYSFVCFGLGASSVLLYQKALRE